MFGLVGQLAARPQQVAFPRRLAMDWAFPMVIGLVGQLAAGWLQVASLSVYLWIGHLMATEWL